VKRGFLFFVSIVLLVGVGLIAYFVFHKPTSTNVGEISIGILRHESSLPFYVADELGLFKKYGLNVKLIELPPGDHMPALLSNRVDIISPTSFPVLFGVMLQHPGFLYAVFPGAELSEGPVVYGIVTRKDFKGHTIHDLRGSVMMAINPFTQVNIKTIFSSARIPEKQWPEIRVASRDVALKAVTDGTAAATIMDQPSLAVAIATGDFRLLEANPRAKYIGSPYWSGAGAVFRQQWNDKRSEYTKLMMAIDEANKVIRRDTLTAHKILAKRLGLSLEIAAQCGGYYYPLSSETVPKEGIQKTVEALVEAGLLEKTISLDNFFPNGFYGEK
jgi:ABC-type nitrate/sulfonate/bicarbonate transport system substrate-binding protein